MSQVDRHGDRLFAWSGGPTAGDLGFLGVDGSDSYWFSAAIIAATMIVMVLLFQGRSWYHGLVALGAWNRVLPQTLPQILRSLDI